MEDNEKTLADYVSILRRRLTVLLASFVAVLLGGVYFVYSLPTTYRSTGTILIEQQNISSDFVQTTVTSYADTQIDIVQQRVMSTPSLTAIVEKFGLYPGMTGPNASYSAAEKLRASTLLERQSVDVGNRAAANTIAFTLSFDHTDAVTAQQVAQELAGLYVSENVARRTNQAELTVEFLQASIDAARRDVDKTSQAIAEFKNRHAGNLPELLNFHLGSIDRTETQLATLDAEIRESRNRQFVLETQLATTNPFSNAVDEQGEPILGTADQLALLQNERLRLLSIYSPAHPTVKQVERQIRLLTGGTGAPEGGAADAQALRTQLATVQAELQQARQAYTDDHPDVVRLSRTAATLQQQLEQASARPRAQSSSLATIASRDPIVQQIQQQIQTEKTYLQSQLVRRADLESKLDEHRRAVAAMPQVEREYEVLERESAFATTRYNEAIAQLDTAQRAQTLESEGSGDRFTLLEPPVLPTTPFSPNRGVLVMLVAILAVGAGIGLAIVTDSLDPTLKGSADLAQVTGAPPLAVIPFLETTTDRRRRLAMTVAKSTALVGGVVTAIGIAAFS